MDVFSVNLAFPEKMQIIWKRVNFDIHILILIKSSSGNLTLGFACSYYFIFFSGLSVLCGHAVFSSSPQRPMTSDFEGFSITDFIHYIYFPIFNSWKRASIFPFECSVLNKGTTGTILITSLVWRGPWLGIEPGTSRTRSQHYTTRLSRRRCLFLSYQRLWRVYIHQHYYNIPNDCSLSLYTCYKQTKKICYANQPCYIKKTWS